MDCTTARETLSALLDGEAGGLEQSAVDRHLATCADCTRFAAGLVVLHRTVRVAPADAVPDLTTAVLRRAAPVRPAPAAEAARLSLALLAVAQVVVTLLTLGDAHASHDIAVWELALAAAFAWSAWRPHRSASLLPVIGAVAILQVANAGIDLVHRPAAGVGEHLAAVVGWYLLTQLHGGARRVLT